MIGIIMWISPIVWENVSIWYLWYRIMLQHVPIKNSIDCFFHENKWTNQFIHGETVPYIDVRAISLRVGFWTPIFSNYACWLSQTWNVHSSKNTIVMNVITAKLKANEINICWAKSMISDNFIVVQCLIIIVGDFIRVLLQTMLW